ncbi:hypothetical protein ACNKHO_15045 [Shigella flexneri]
MAKPILRDESEAATLIDKVIEFEIMRAPEQYLWMHHRLEPCHSGRILHLALYI